jgi:hypothetical protein
MDPEDLIPALTIFNKEKARLTNTEKPKKGNAANIKDIDISITGQATRTYLEKQQKLYDAIEALKVRLEKAKNPETKINPKYAREDLIAFFEKGIKDYTKKMNTMYDDTEEQIWNDRFREQKRLDKFERERERERKKKEREQKNKNKN